jgi:hypothetical protein
MEKEKLASKETPSNGEVKAEPIIPPVSELEKPKFNPFKKRAE